jgi:hypothetical protein
MKKRDQEVPFLLLFIIYVWVVNYLHSDRRSVCLRVPFLLLVCVKARLHLLQPRIVFVLEGGLILANFLLQSLATLGAQLRSQIDRQCEEAEGKEESHVAGNHGGSWMVVDCCGGKIFFNFFKR